MQNRVCIFDSTLRDGMQAQGVSFGIDDKIKITQVLDEIGVHYIEAGSPASNPRNLEFFTRARAELDLKNAKLCAFGSTRCAGTVAEEDLGLKSLLDTGATVISIVGKTWDVNVQEILRTSLEENLAMISDSIRFLKAEKKEVVFDAEHFFDGYRSNPIYAVKVLQAAAQAGADWLVLCDTNGGTLPFDVYEVIQQLLQNHRFANLGIHCHNDAGTAVANSLLAVRAGVHQVQGTFTGVGERCGNTSLTSVIAGLHFKMGISVIPAQNIGKLFTAYQNVCRISNICPNEKEPYVGRCAFAHKAGMHIDGVYKNPAAFEHVVPESIGNKRKILVSELAGRSTILPVVNRIDPTIQRCSVVMQRILKKLKERESTGLQYERAEQSFELMVRKELGLLKNFFRLVTYTVSTTCTENGNEGVTAEVLVNVDGVCEKAVICNCNEPIQALDLALRSALSRFYREIMNMQLSDYEAKTIGGNSTTPSQVRVVVESTDGVSFWKTVGVSQNIIAASFQAIIDAVEYKLMNIYTHCTENGDTLVIEEASCGNVR